MKTTTHITLFLLAALSANAFGGDAKVTLDSSNGSSAFTVRDSASNELARVSSDGKVGIGTATPTAQLDVLTSNTFGISSTGSTTGSTGLYHIANTNAPTAWNLGVEGGAWASGAALGSLYIDKDGVGPKMTITPDGNVGIGTITPSVT
jgi:hypothetical protein